MSTVGLDFGSPSPCESELTTPVADGGVVSIQNGPACTVAVQLPATSHVRRWKYQSLPSASSALMVVCGSAVCGTSTTASGAENAEWFHSNE